MEIPVRIGQRVTLLIHGITHDAEGVGRLQGFAVFVPEAIPGDEVEAEVISVKKQYARALIYRILKESPDRVTPLCSHYHECGGCQLMHASYQAQLRYKRQQVESALKRIGGLEGVVVHETLGMANSANYRNKAQFPVGMQAGRIAAGCFKPRSHDIVDIASCGIQHDANNRALVFAKELAQKYKISVYDERLHEGLLRHILVKHAFSTNETMVVFVINGESLPQGEKIAEELMSRLTSVVSVQINTNKRPSNVILGPETKLIAGRDYIIDELDGLKFKISARSFYQVNPAQTKVLYGKAREYAALTGRESVFDLYCGVGTIALFMAAHAKHVIGIEIVPEAIRDAEENAHLNRITNTEFICGAAEDVVPRLIKQGQRPDVYIVDPPRTGCDEKLLATIAANKPDRLVYVSCNPATLARDLKYLSERGFAVVEVQPVDMFPHTSHVECVVLMSRVKE
ncbi:MAG: 23S rRNA (uracil1939-C5)-methyltransferase [Bacillota bacterium]|nr:MAG: 23S rRNA (uracil1939-C5)-methyltransferase [Bacillota bacterium]